MIIPSVELQNLVVNSKMIKVKLLRDAFAQSIVKLLPNTIKKIPYTPVLMGERYPKKTVNHSQSFSLTINVFQMYVMRGKSLG